MNGNQQEMRWMSETMVDPMTLNKCPVSASAAALRTQKRARKQDLRVFAEPERKQNQEEKIAFHQLDPMDPNISSALRKTIIKAKKSKSYRDQRLKSLQESKSRVLELEAELAKLKGEMAKLNDELEKTKTENAKLKTEAGGNNQISELPDDLNLDLDFGIMEDLLPNLLEEEYSMDLSTI